MYILLAPKSTATTRARVLAEKLQKKLGVNVKISEKPVENTKLNIVLQTFWNSELLDLVKKVRCRYLIVADSEDLLKEFGIHNYASKPAIVMVRGSRNYTLKAHIGTKAFKNGIDLVASPDGTPYSIQIGTGYLIAIKPFKVDEKLVTENFVEDIKQIVQALTHNHEKQRDITKIVAVLKEKIREERRREYFSKTARALEYIASGDVTNIDATTLELLVDLGLVKVLETESQYKFIPNTDLARQVIRTLEREGYL